MQPPSIPTTMTTSPPLMPKFHSCSILWQLSSSSPSAVYSESSVTQAAEALGLAVPAKNDSTGGNHATSNPDTAAATTAVNTSISIDCRSEEEQATGIVPGSINLPYPHNGNDELIDPNEWLQDLVEELLDGDEEGSHDIPIYVICRKGPRSAMACEVLRDAGYTDVTNVRGGMMAWARAGLPMAVYKG